MHLPFCAIRVPAFIAFSCLSALGLGCGKPESETDVIAADATIKLVSNAARRDTPTIWQLDTTPLHDWGGLKDNPTDEFEHRNGYLSAVLRSDGMLVVIDRSVIREYNPTGVEVAKFGRAGSGPAEFRGLRLVCVFHTDTMAVYDFINGRLSIIAPGARQTTTALIAGHGSLIDSPCLGDGTLVRQYADGTVERFDRTGASVDTLGMMPRDRDREGFQTTAFLVASAGRLISGIGTEPWFTVVDVASGKRVRVAFDEMVPEGFEATGVAPRFEGNNRAESDAESRRAAATKEAYVFFDQMVAGSDGDIWIRDALPTSDHASSEWWTRFDGAGHVVGRLEIPALPYDDTPRDAQGRPPIPPFRPMLLQGTDSTVLLLRRDVEGAVHFSEYALVVKN